MTTMTRFADALMAAVNGDEGREAALARFNDRGWPTRRDEAFRYLDLRPLHGVDWALSGAQRADECVGLELPGAITLVFVGGRFDEAASDPMPEGVSIGNCHDSIAADVDPFTDLCLAACDQTLHIKIEAEVSLSGPLHIVHETRSDEPMLSAQRCVISAQANSSCVVVESIRLEGNVLCTPVTEISAAPEARVEFARIIDGTEDAWCCGTIAVRAEADAVVHASAIPFGGCVNRTRLESTLAGEHAHVDLRGLGVAGGNRHVETVLSVRHAAPDCTSNMLFKHVLGDTARASFTGRINVDEGAHGTDAVQTSRNMLLSDGAKAWSRPQLEIYADDVKCTHGSTTGRPDAEADFYLRARGIDPGTTASLLVWAFAAEVLDELEPSALRVQAASRLLDQLPGGDKLDPTVVAPDAEPDAT
ncbi:MAG: Fe-S cluster assembly protein SufD [Phycisphaerales bacterium]|nr:Fe-S cluster assembly protein SufD [Phycisphaerales bacterium]